MLEDLEFIVGDLSDLRGRGILFAENLSGTENPFNPRFPALAVAADPSELLALLGSIAPLPEAVKDSLLEKIKQSTDLWSRTMFGQPMYRSVRDILDKGLDQIKLPDELKDQIREEMENIPDEPTGVPFHACFMPLVGFDPNVIEPFKSNCDVARVPAVSSITYAGLVLTGHAQHYLAAHFRQREEMGAEGEGEPVTKILSAQDLSPSEFLALLNRKVSELMYARESGLPIEELIRELRKLTAGTLFIRDVLNLARFFDTSHPKKIEIFDLYIQRISLLAKERYEEIPDLDRRLETLLGKP